MFKNNINDGGAFPFRFPTTPALFDKSIFPRGEMKMRIDKHLDIKHQKNILVVEDDKNSIIYIQRILNNKFNLEVATNAREAIGRAVENQYDLILMDINLGSQNGLFTTKEIRKMRNYKETPIIAMTAFTMKGDKDVFLAHGCSHYLPKPFEEEELIEMMNNILN